MKNSVPRITKSGMHELLLELKMAASFIHLTQKKSLSNIKPTNHHLHDNIAKLSSSTVQLG